MKEAKKSAKEKGSGERRIRIFNTEIAIKKVPKIQQKPLPKSKARAISYKKFHFKPLPIIKGSRISNNFRNFNNNLKNPRFLALILVSLALIGLLIYFGPRIFWICYHSAADIANHTPNRHI